MGIYAHTDRTGRHWKGDQLFTIKLRLYSKNGEPSSTSVRTFKGGKLLGTELSGEEKFNLLNSIHWFKQSYSIVLLKWEWLLEPIESHFIVEHTQFKFEKNKPTDIWVLTEKTTGLNFVIRKYAGKKFTCRISFTPNVIVIGPEIHEQYTNEKEVIAAFCKRLRNKATKEFKERV